MFQRSDLPGFVCPTSTAIRIHQELDVEPALK